MTNPFPPGSALAAYLRDSGGAKQELSTAQQEQVIRAWCAERGYRLARLFVDAARPGGTTVGRDAFEQLIQYFERKPDSVAGVLFWDYSRWARNVTDGQYFLSLLRVRGYDAYSIQEQIPPGPVGQIVEASYLAMAEQYRAQLSANARRGLHYIVGQHHAWPAPIPPTGYAKKPVIIGVRRDGSPREINRLEPDPDTAPAVQDAFRMAAAGYTYEEINAKHPIFRKASNWHNLFRKSIYTGVLEYGGKIYPNFCTPLVDRDTFERVQARIAQSVGDRKPRSKTSPFLFSGRIYCARCGARMLGGGSEKSYQYYYCADRCGARNLFIRDFEPAALAAIADLLDRREVLEDLRTELIRRQTAGDSDRTRALERARRDRDTARAAVENLVAHLAAMPPGGKSGALLNELERQEQAARDAADRIAALKAAAPPVVIAADDLHGLAQTLRAAVQTAPRRQKQLLIQQIVTRIEAQREGEKYSKKGKFTGVIYYDLAGLHGEVQF